MEKNKVKIIEGNSDHINLLFDINSKIPEFDIGLNIDYLNGRVEGKINIILISYIDEEPVGYLIGYERDSDGSFYCWLAAVLPRHRRKGILREMMKYLEDWAAKRGYDKIKIKTRNSRREMLHYLVKSEFHFVEVEPSSEIFENVIHLEKRIIE